MAVPPPAGSRVRQSADERLVTERKWQVRSSQTILQDRWINLRADHCVTASGADIDPYYVLAYPDWVHIVAITPADGLVLIRQYRHAAGAFVGELPAGAVDASDTNEEAAARRELAEETGYIAARWQFICTLHANPATHTNRIHTFVAHDAVPAGPQSLEAGEDGLTVHVMPIADVLAGLTGGLLGQAMQVSAVLLGLAAAGRLELKL